MFPAIKKKFSTALVNSVILCAVILACYLARHVALLYQQYQKYYRLESYMGELEDVITRTHRLQAGVQGVGKEFKLIEKAVESSLSIDLSHPD